MEIEVRNTLDNDGKIWHKKGNKHYYHREDGPAVIYNNGEVEWWYYNTLYVYPKDIPLNLFLAYCKWEYKKNGN